MSEKVAGVGWRIALSLALGFFMAWLLRDLEPRQQAVRFLALVGDDGNPV